MTVWSKRSIFWLDEMLCADSYLTTSMMPLINFLAKNIFCQLWMQNATLVWEKIYTTNHLSPESLTKCSQKSQERPESSFYENVKEHLTVRFWKREQTARKINITNKDDVLSMSNMTRVNVFDGRSLVAPVSSMLMSYRFSSYSSTGPCCCRSELRPAVSSTIQCH